MAQVFTSLLDRPHVKRTWRPLQALSRALIVGTFVDDFVRIASDYTGQVDSMRTVGFGDPASSFLPALFCAVQGIGAGLVLSGQARFVQTGCIVLISWSAAHPFLYKQQRNTEFVVEEVSIIGGLLILLSSTRATHPRYFFFQQWSTAGAWLQLVVFGPGRLSLDEAVHGETSALHAMEAKATD